MAKLVRVASLELFDGPDGVGDVILFQDADRLHVPDSLGSVRADVRCVVSRNIDLEGLPQELTKRTES